MRNTAIFALAVVLPFVFGHGDEGNVAAEGLAASSVSVQDFGTAFTAGGIVPDVLAAFNPTVAFYASYNTGDGQGAALIAPGTELSTAEAVAPQEFSVEGIANATNVTDSTRFIIVMVGPDAPSRANPTNRSIRHYLAGNFTVGTNVSSVLSTASTLVNSSAPFTSYGPPAPPAGTGVHRYIYLLYVQPEALNGSSSLPALVQFRTQAGLGPAIGGTYFTIDAAGGNGTAEGSGNSPVPSSGSVSMVSFAGFLATFFLVVALLVKKRRHRDSSRFIIFLPLSDVIQLTSSRKVSAKPIMSASPKLRRDYVYMIIFGIQLIAILLVDLPPFYPPTMGNSEGSPLRILFRLRQYYIDAYNDRYFVTPHDELPSWFLLFTYLEIAYQLPMVFWMLRVFEDHTKGTTPGFELACVVYGVEVALTTLTCVFDVPYWDRAVYSTSEKANFMFLIYGPWVLIPSILAYDMGHRLLARAKAADQTKAIKTKKNE
ncbi:hypothetical protein BN1723_003589 [Verticillium longisporum]|uniref:EXPERA domain-containing protein n=1 Tax=Verticillium longisporum TaxID=100787 RepID=A0A0G4M679_VERLO|nr:hypothetical protein BN1723_003589 [Verticillium longisporum]